MTSKSCLINIQSIFHFHLLAVSPPYPHLSESQDRQKQNSCSAREIQNSSRISLFKASFPSVSWRKEKVMEYVSLSPLQKIIQSQWRTTNFIHQFYPNDIYYGPLVLTVLFINTYYKKPFKIQGRSQKYWWIGVRNPAVVESRSLSFPLILRKLWIDGSVLRMD